MGSYETRVFEAHFKVYFIKNLDLIILQLHLFLKPELVELDMFGNEICEADGVELYLQLWSASKQAYCL
jgi:hypothetical protein